MKKVASSFFGGGLAAAAVFWLTPILAMDEHKVLMM
jgi:hypothetical protein